MTLAELYRELERHDWFFEMSDDPRVYSQGREHWDRMQRDMMTVEGGPELVRAYTKHVFSGPAFGTPKAPKPAKPDELTGSQLADALAKATKGQP
jgi:hypothetical protein